MNKLRAANRRNLISRPVFVTRFGLSDRTAIGAQTLNILKLFPQWYHLYWAESLFDKNVINSYRLESWAFCRLSPLRRNNWLKKKSEQMKWTWWSDDRIIGPGKALVSSLKEKASSAYYAPLEAKDARRMKQIAELITKPFVVHLWDFLDNNISDESTQWLIKNADRVFCLNSAMANAVKENGRDSEILQFTRSIPNFRCKYIVDREIRISLMGNIGSYIEGVRKLIAAVHMINKSGWSAQIIYIGRSNILRQFGISQDHVKATGFIESIDEKDRVLSNCNMAFMPGPSASPENDPQSKYSIPSRILDFLGIGLPIVGTVHPLSATSEFCCNLGVDADIFCKDPDRIAESILALTKKDHWERSSQLSLRAFKQVICAHNVERLKAALGCNTESR